MTTSYYAKHIRKILTSSGPTPPIEVLEILLRWYIADAEKWYTKRNHTMLASLMVFWIEDYRKTATENKTSRLTRPDDLLRKLTVKLNTLELLDVNPDGEFVALMNTFFACYPDYAAFLQPSVSSLLAPNPYFFDPRQPVNYQLELLSGDSQDKNSALRVIATFNYADTSPEQRRQVMQELFLLLSGSSRSFEFDHVIKGIHRLHKDFAVELPADGLGKLLNINNKFETASSTNDCYQLYYLEVCLALLEKASDQQKTLFTKFVLALSYNINPHTPAKEKLEIAIQQIQNHLAQEFQTAAAELFVYVDNPIINLSVHRLKFLLFSPNNLSADLISRILETAFVSSGKESCWAYQRFLAEADIRRIFDKIWAGLQAGYEDYQQAACDLLQALTHPNSPHSKADICKGLMAYGFLLLIFNSQISSRILAAIHVTHYPEILKGMSIHLQNNASSLSNVVGNNLSDESGPFNTTKDIQSLARLIKVLVQDRELPDEQAIAILPMIFAKRIPATTIIQSLKPLTPSMLMALQNHALKNVKFLMNPMQYFDSQKLYNAHVQDLKLLRALFANVVAEEQLVLIDILLQEIHVMQYAKSQYFNPLYTTLIKTFTFDGVNLSIDFLNEKLRYYGYYDHSTDRHLVIELICLKALIPYASPSQKQKIVNHTITFYTAMSEEDFRNYNHVQPHALAAEIIISLIDYLPKVSYPLAHTIFRNHLQSPLSSAEDCLKTYTALRSLNTASKLHIDDNFNVKIATKNLLFVAKSYPQITCTQIDRITHEEISDPANTNLCVSFAQELFRSPRAENSLLLNSLINFYIRCLGPNRELTSVVTGFLHLLWDSITDDRKIFLFERYATLLNGMRMFLRPGRLTGCSEIFNQHKICISVLNRCEHFDANYKEFIIVFAHSRLMSSTFSQQEVSILFGLMSDSMKQHIVNAHLNLLYNDMKYYQSPFAKVPSEEWKIGTEDAINHFVKNISVFDNASRMLLINAYLNLLAETKVIYLARYILNVLPDLQPYIPTELRDEVTDLLLKHLDTNFEAAFNVLQVREKEYSPLERKIYFYPLMLCEYSARLNTNGSIPPQYYPLQIFARIRYNEKQFARMIARSTKLIDEVTDLITGYLPPFCP